MCLTLQLPAGPHPEVRTPRSHLPGCALCLLVPGQVLYLRRRRRRSAAAWAYSAALGARGRAQQLWGRVGVLSSVGGDANVGVGVLSSLPGIQQGMHKRDRMRHGRLLMGGCWTTYAPGSCSLCGAERPHRLAVAECGV